MFLPFKVCRDADFNLLVMLITLWNSTGVVQDQDSQEVVVEVTIFLKAESGVVGFRRRRGRGAMGSESERVLKYGIIGVGMMGREHLYNLAALPGAMVVAVADPHPGSREAALAATAGLQSVVPSPPLQVRTPHKGPKL